MQAGGRRFDSVHLHQPGIVSAAIRPSVFGHRLVVSSRSPKAESFRFFDIVKRVLNDVLRFGAAGATPTVLDAGEHVSLRMPLVGFGLRVGFREDESSVTGRSVDALALRGDEGRSTLR